MKFIYPAIFKKTKDGYEGTFPDLEGIHVKGSDLDDCIRNAIHAEEEWLNLEFTEEDPYLPPVSDIADLKLKKGEIAREIAVHIRFHVGWDE